MMGGMNPSISTSTPTSSNNSTTRTRFNVASLNASVGIAETDLELEVEPAEKPGRGRPSILTADMTVVIYGLIRSFGLTDSRAALMAGISTSTISRWKEAEPAFADYLETARIEFEIDRTRRLLEAKRPDGSPEWRAHAWLLKNSQRDENARRPGRPRKEREPETRADAPPLVVAVAPDPAAAPAEKKVREIPENRAVGLEKGEKIPESQPVTGVAGLDDAGSSLGAPARDGAGFENSERIPENRIRVEAPSGGSEVWEGNGVSAALPFPKRFANFGNERNETRVMNASTSEAESRNEQ